MKKNFLDKIISICLLVVVILAIAGFDRMMLDNAAGNELIITNFYYIIALQFFLISVCLIIIKLILNKKYFRSNKIIKYKIGINITTINEILLKEELTIYNDYTYTRKVNNNEILIVSIFKNELNYNLLNEVYNECVNKYNITEISSLIILLVSGSDKNFINNIKFEESEKKNTLICGIDLKENTLYIVNKRSNKNHLKYCELLNLALNIFNIESNKTK